ncbi:MAG: hypothetical protein HY671_04050 [Chloroflexi bacterium]|nr:hypothetical protein [Chloroflexota bacterium]
MPVVKYHCSKCEEGFELTRPQAKANDYMACPKCGKPCAPQSSFGGGPSRRSEFDAPPVKGKNLPPWARGQVEAQVRQLVKTGDAVGSHQVDLITQAVLRELAAADMEVTPANIRVAAQKHVAELDSWARTARRAGAQMDAADKLEED